MSEVVVAGVERHDHFSTRFYAVSPRLQNLRQEKSGTISYVDATNT